MASVWNKTDDGKEHMQEFAMHKCNDSDFEKFYAPAKTIYKTITSLREKEYFWCLDTNDFDGKPLNSRLFGRETMDSYRYIDFRFVHCLPQEMNDTNKHLKNETCMVENSTWEAKE